MPNAPKCDNCGKGITKKSPGLECRCCEKIVHASQACTGLTAKQLSALRNTDSLDWTCSDCQRDSPHRKSSFITPDVEDEEDDEEVPSGRTSGNCNIDTEKFLRDVTSQMNKILKKQLEPIEISLAACVSKIDDLTKTVELQGKEIKDLGRKHNHLKNEQAHLQLEVRALKQYVRTFDQQRLDSVLEVVGLPKLEQENIQEVSYKLASIMDMDKTEISYTKRVDGRNGKDGIILIGLQQVQQAEVWARAARKQTMLVENIISSPPPSVAQSKVWMRRALTKANKALLWEAQQKLRPSYKYVWFQDGKVLVRKEDNEKPLVVRAEEDIDDLATQAVTRR